MAEFDPETFEEEKYREHFAELQRAYKNAFEEMKAEYGSDLVHAIDQQVLNESEPHFREGTFTIELPEDPAGRLTAADPDDETLAAALSDYTDEIVAQLHDLLDVPREEA